MEEKILLLIELQDCDKKRKRVLRKKEEVPERIKLLDDRMKEIDDKLDKELRQLEEYRLERRRLEREIDDRENKIVKSNIKLGNIKSNKEYQAALKEISDLKAEKAVYEDKAIEVMEHIERLEEISRQSKAQETELCERCESLKIVILEEAKAMDEEIKRLEIERERICLSIDADLLKMYNFISQHRDGLSISPVIKGVCQACNMGIPPQKFNELIRGNELMSCPHCKRIIYWGENERFRAVDRG
ncbi:MAG: hypothetical protein JXA35_11375 [Deltaproteobacteria bacterium]|nr:hypothetical protein [Deltaproteobacteria bacterium]